MKILLVNGPNLNNLGERDVNYYGSSTLTSILENLSEIASSLDVEIKHFQSNQEGNIVDFLQSERDGSDGLIINGGALTHYGLSLRDAVLDAGIPFVEIHISNIHSRDGYRRHSVVEDIAVGQIAGLGVKGYEYALQLIVQHVRSQKKN
ncbi:MAG: type II 3-dehydroquinate dehydratase [SAR202 cluster bacterium]|nr:type II 3-dehydroquinate dehydratase [SAR202 cluster bacterium]|tara:strand:- start:371 stop:817 length:447 start_codon:yes stop_codon:yes gene_type:complete